MGASLFGFTKLYGQVPGGQAEYLRVPQAQFGPIKVPEGPADERFLYLSDVLPTAWQAVEYARIPEGGSVVVFGLGPIGQMAARIARYRGARVIAVDSVPERNAMARRHGIEVVDSSVVDDVTTAIRDLTDGRGTDSAIDAVGMEAHGGSAIPQIAQKVVGKLPDAIAAPLLQVAGVDRTAALVGCVDAVRRAGVVSLSGVYGGTADPINMLKIFDKGISLQMGQAHVKRWVPEILPLLTDERPARRPRPRDPPAAARVGGPRVRDLPEEAGRVHQGRPGAVSHPEEPSLSFIGTATTLLRCGGFTILTDPNFLFTVDRPARR